MPFHYKSFVAVIAALYVGGMATYISPAMAQSAAAEEKALLSANTSAVPDSDLIPTKSDDDSSKLSGCATDTWKGMVNQAVLEARRETVINQTYIVKPDSVLSYACYDKWLQSVKANARPIFSKTEKFASEVKIGNKELNDTRKPKTKNIPGFQRGEAYHGGGSIDEAMKDTIEKTVEAVANVYLPANFNHKMLGDTSDISGSGANLAGGNCGLMQEMWKAAKCKNFSSAKVFYKFDEMIGFDPRQFPATMPCNDTGIKQEMIDWAQNKEYKKVKFDKVKTQFKYLTDPSSCDLSVVTGIKVHKRENGQLNTSIKDVVCSNVGCSSDKGTCKRKM